ncbi:hypothetical protein [Mesomycoplasma molare]|uniref:DUF4231 domain-containing protein n=1 Tax=Mesomycoplasma molare TaxID=171288 RepID=A0ABY5TU77_9BACT|nr:hypothetical protein [Mesomycoplasma molare]UWD34219.1 DUF4231 domain-containing protein [Mesomycoplasma molare]
MNQFELEINKAKQKIAELNKKYIKSKWTFLIVSIALLLMSAFNGLLSAYAIAKNPNLTAVWLFVSISFITAIMAFLTASSTLFAFSKRRANTKSKLEYLEKIEKELQTNTLSISRDELVVELAQIDLDE